jgi:hypothetical protein
MKISDALRTTVCLLSLAMFNGCVSVADDDDDDIEVERTTVTEEVTTTPVVERRVVY